MKKFITLFKFATLASILSLAFLSSAFAAKGPESKIPKLNALAGSWQKASTLLCYPALNSTQGSSQCVDGVLQIGNLSFPPILMNGNTGAMHVDGKIPKLEETRWYAYQALREGHAGDLRIETAVRMMYEKRGLLFHIDLKNVASARKIFHVEINLAAYTSEHKSWGWQMPRDADSVSFSAKSIDGGRSLLLENAGAGLSNCFSFETTPDNLSVNKHSGAATWTVTLQPHGSRVINYVLIIGHADESVHELAAQTAAHFPSAFDAVKIDWESRWSAMFTPGNAYFSGHLPVLVTADKDLRRMYYMSILSLLSVYRTCFPVAPRAYISNSPESNCIMMYFWDTREWATTLALLDPAMMKEYLTSWLSKGIYNGYAEEFLTGSMQGVWYSANDYSIFILLNDYLDVTHDTAFLSEKINGKTVLQHMYEIATHWKSLVKPGHTLANYGDASNLLECVPTYIGEVASLNAANVWLMQRTAQVEEAMGHRKKAEHLRSMAKSLLAAVMKLHVPGKGYWYSVHDNGKRVAVRTIFDFATIGLTLTKDLSQRLRNEMLHFVDTQLLTAHWMRALSWRDPAAAESNRPDHGPIGAFCAWPAETMAVMCEFGKYGQALKFLHRCTGTTYEGPFSQSRQLIGKGYDAPVHITDFMTFGYHSQTYNGSNGGSFAETIIREFFGYQPNHLTHTLISNVQPRGFDGELLDVRDGNRTYNIISDKNGIRIVHAGRN